MAAPKKSLGQHWLFDPESLQAMVDLAHVTADDTVLEIGPGLGTLTTKLTKRAKHVIAVEFDSELADKLPGRVPAKNLTVINKDILQFNLTTLPKDYKVAANVPYYITSKIVELLLTSPNPPIVAALLVQKEVAERMAARAGDLSILGIATQFYAEASLGPIVPARLFTPPPRVDSQIIRLRRHDAPPFPDIDERLFFRVVRAGFSAKRKKLRSSLAGGLGIDKDEAVRLLQRADVNPDNRAETLTLEQWAALSREVGTM